MLPMFERLGAILTESGNLRYCSSVRMPQGTNVRAFAIIALLLPGLAMAAPVAGPCGLCESGVSCPSMEQARVEVEPSSCCGDDRETPQVPSTDTMDCDCGREAPLAAAVEIAPADGASWMEAQSKVAVNERLAVDAPALVAVIPAPLPPLSLFLIDCAFLT